MCTSSAACPSLSRTRAAFGPRLRNIVTAAEASTTIKSRYSTSRGSSASRILRMVTSGGSSTSTGSSFATRSSHSFMVGFAATCSISEIYPHTGRALSVGFTGPPGVGKSSIIAKLIELYREDDRRVGVVSVDPSSPFSKGAILGDRIRLSDHFLDPGVFMRSMGSRGHLGGLAGASRLAALAMEAFGMDVTLYETVGVGQGEVEVASAADTVVLALQPGAGDAVQALKAGVMEIADIFCINKADHPQAKGAANEVRSILEIGQELDPDAPTPPIVMTRGDNGEGVEELETAIERHRSYLEESGGVAEGGGGP